MIAAERLAAVRRRAEGRRDDEAVDHVARAATPDGRSPGGARPSLGPESAGGRRAAGCAAMTARTREFGGGAARPLPGVAISRRAFLRGAAATAAVAALPRAAEARPLGAARLEQREFAVPGLDPAHDGLRVVQLSDLHCGAQTPPDRIRDAVARANALAPDLVVLTGDYVCRQRSGIGLVRELLGGIAAPTVAVLGNHDHWVGAAATARALAGHGYAVLRNENTTLRLRGAPLTVIGIDDLMTGHAQPGDALRGARPGSRLVLAHGPRTAEALAARGEPLLCLSGHTHGGQVHLPGVTRWMLRALAHEPYDRGLFHVGSVQLYVNRGVGNSALRIRIDSDPEVTLATLRPVIPAA